ncbi:hypothetical protein ACFL0X_00400 [Nanoarchaeota archaeon]
MKKKYNQIKEVARECGSLLGVSLCIPVYAAFVIGASSLLPDVSAQRDRTTAIIYHALGMGITRLIDEGNDGVVDRRVEMGGHPKHGFFSVEEVVRPEDQEVFDSMTK